MIGYAELPVWVPGEILCASDDLQWNGVSQRSYRYRGQDVEIPPMDCFMLVHYEDGFTPMDRQLRRPLDPHQPAPAGVFSLLSNQGGLALALDRGHRGLACVPREPDAVPPGQRDAGPQPVDQVRLHDVLSGRRSAGDPAWPSLLRQEAATGQRRLLAVCRGAVDPAGRAPAAPLRHLPLSPARRMAPRPPEPRRRRAGCRTTWTITWPTTITLDDLAQVAGRGRVPHERGCCARTFDTTAYRYVVDRRIERARQLLQRGDLPLKAVARQPPASPTRRT